MNNISVITHVMEPVVPGTLTVMTVGNIQDNTKLYAFEIGNNDPRLPSETRRLSRRLSCHRPRLRRRLRPGEQIRLWRKLPIVQRKDECVTADFPSGKYAVFALDTQPVLSAGAYIVNRPRLDWHCPTNAVTGEKFRIIGRNLVSIDNYPTKDKSKPVSFGGLLKGKTKIVARMKGADEFIDIPVLKSSCYEAHIKLPKKFKTGDYELFAHNGMGGPLGWSEPIPVAVVKQKKWPKDVFKVDDYVMENEESASPAINHALADIAKNNGGILEFSRGTYSITETIILPKFTVVRGQGLTRTLLLTPGDGGPKPPYVLFTGDSDFVIEDLRVLTVYTGLIVVAPTFLPSSLVEAIDIPFHFTKIRAKNVTVRGCHFTQRIASHSDRTSAKDYLEFVNKYIVSCGQGHTGFSCIHIKGDDIALENNTLLGGGSCVMLSGCSHSRIYRNVLKCGPAGHGFYAIAKLLWPKDGAGGAKIKGNYCSEIILEENDITSYSERGRDLAYFIFGSEHAHVARNTLHDLEPTFDAEGFGCHLWSARWIEPSIRMISPTAGEIIDPKGEVTDECLDGAIIDVVGGKGMGQLRRIVKRDGNTFEIDKPWRFAPDETSDVVFTAPPPFYRMTFIDNVAYSTGINFILWGNSNDVVLDGNNSSDGLGISIWSIRLAADQKVWGGAIFSLIINNTLHMNWFNPTEQQIKEGVWAGGGICNPCTKSVDCTSEGYDMLGYVVRNNFLNNQSGILFKTTFGQTAGDTLTGHPVDEKWTIRNAGVVIENNLIKDSKVGVMIEKGANAIERNNLCENVKHPVVWMGKD